MEAAKAQLIAEIGDVDGCEIEVIATLIIGPMGDFCGGCWMDEPCTVVVHWTGAIDGTPHNFDVALSRSCAVEWIRRNTLYVPEMVVELGLYADNIDDTAHLVRPVAVPATADFNDDDDDNLPPCELED